MRIKIVSGVKVDNIHVVSKNRPPKLSQLFASSLSVLVLDTFWQNFAAYLVFPPNPTNALLFGHTAAATLKALIDKLISACKKSNVQCPKSYFY